MPDLLTTVNPLDVVLAVVLLMAAATGWGAGLISRAGAFVGWLLGGLLGLKFLPWLFQLWPVLEDQPLLRLLGLGLAVLLMASIGSGLGAAVVAPLVQLTRMSGAIRRIDQLLGAVTAAVLTALLMWAIAPAARPVLPTEWAQQVNQSRILGAVDDQLPARASTWFSRISRSLNAERFPTVFGSLFPEPIQPVPAPDASTLDDPEVRQARASVVRIETSSATCGSTRGSGWVVAPQRVVTNAHVIAGADQVSVRLPDASSSLPARVVALDEDLDLAILRVDALQAAPLPREDTLSSQDSAVVAGYPAGGGYAITPARVRSELTATGHDIYGQQQVRREIYALRATVVRGNSGGPLLTLDGTVAGTIFARSVEDSATAYALTDDATDNWLDRAAELSQQISTGACLRS